jgi:hypothetical protein
MTKTELMRFKPRSKFPHVVASYVNDDLLNEVNKFCVDHNCSKSEAIRLLMQNGLAAMLLDDG